ncbi:IPT/TIG domain-containing protein [Cryptosporangium minutisporangium]|uniref:IPT/TIG domain-containing protein n=1 Tax=Cryptosporangium minutisporangium TaxID=113569 RepID=A0ABP6T933_9ACTN
MLAVRTRRTRLVAALGASVLASGAVLAGASIASAAVAPALSIKSLSISKGNIAGGTAVVITGKGFNALDEGVPASVMFGTQAVAFFNVLSDTQLATRAPVPASSDLRDLVKVQVKITDGDHTTANTTADDFTYLPPIAVAVPADTVFSAAGGTVVRLTLSGDNLDLGTAPTFASKKISATVNGVLGKLKYVDATHVDLAAPPGTPTTSGGAVTVAVFNDGVPGPVDDEHATYAAVVSRLSVTSGKTTGTEGIDGDKPKPALTITGAGLTGAEWKIGEDALSCTAVAGKASTTWTCQDIPAGDAGPVSVLPEFSNGAVAAVTAGATYTYSEL